MQQIYTEKQNNAYTQFEHSLYEYHISIVVELVRFVAW